MAYVADEDLLVTISLTWYIVVMADPLLWTVVMMYSAALVVLDGILIITSWWRIIRLKTVTWRDYYSIQCNSPDIIDWLAD